MFYLASFSQKDFASTTDYSDLNREEKLHFIKAFAFQTIWSMSKQEHLPPHQSYEAVTALAGSSDKTMAENAKLAHNLFLSVQNYYQKK